MPTIDDDDDEEVQKPQIPKDVPKKEQFGMKIETAVSVKESDIQWKPKSINVDLGNMVFELDALQQELLNRYLRQDQNFLRAFYTNYTELFMTFIRDKARLNEPITISIMGQTRTLPFGSSVLMSDGSWKKVEDVVIGDWVISPQIDGTTKPAKVTFSQAYFSDKVYDIFHRIDNTLLYSCTYNHLIPFLELKNKKGKYQKELIHLTPEEFLRQSPYKQKGTLKTFISPCIDKFEGRPNSSIDPYTLGVFLGNGWITNSIDKRGNRDAELRIIQGINDFQPIEKIKLVYPIIRSNVRKEKNVTEHNWSNSSQLFKELSRLGLDNCKSDTKFIPRECLLSDANYRKELLAGLIDTGGYSVGTFWEYFTKSERLAKDIQFLVGSLGGQAKRLKFDRMRIRKDGSTYHQEGVRMAIHLDCELPLQIQRKKLQKKGKYHRNTHIPVRIERGNDSCVQSIAVDSPSRWYVTDNWMVTHNSGKSTSGITIAGLLMEARGKLMDAQHIQANQFEFMTALKNPDITHFGDCFVIDESKDAVFGVGSSAKKFKLGDIQNIIAVNNISTIWIRPDGWAFDNSLYGLRAFGRGQFYKDGTKAPCRINRFMLYNLQESSAGGSLPLGMIYLPHFSDVLTNGEQLWKDYSAKKQAWVDAEQKGESDTLVNDLFNVAEKIYNYPKYKLLKGGNQKKTFIQTALGSEATKGEISTIYEMCRLLENGFSLEEIKNMNKMQG